jgi:isoleucyl-tRNA synthetase
MNWKDTLNLPDPSFTIPMKADLTQREPGIQEIWDAKDIYRKIQAFRKDAPTFVLHDGPPYTNGPIHLGTAMNKVLKDFVVKSQTLMGHRAPYVPGFDTHGLPIEMAVMKKFAEKKVNPTILELRKACREHAETYIEVQSKQFKRLGVFGMWDKPYTSMGFRYEAEIIRVFKRLVEKGHIYRGLRPVLWSPTSRTALADTEIIYKDVVSKAIYVAFPLKHDPSGFLANYPKAEAVIWTTTPWTIPANLAIAFHPEYTYQIVSANGRELIVVTELAEKTMQAIGASTYEVLGDFRGREAEGLVFAHPLYGRDSLAVLADYVTTEDGTGLVHTAPGHGREDFLTGMRYKLPVLCPVDASGRLTEEAPGFVGVSYKDCDTLVLESLEAKGALLSSSDYPHSYPHAERDEKPVIFRATEQWFISVDANGLRELMLNEIKATEWYPASGERRITSMIEGRPDWCVSRQRPWGVGIPILYGKESGEPALDPVAIEAAAQMVEKEGSDSWYSREPGDFLPQGYRHPVTGETEFTKETDVFDVWFDSACTNLCVLEGKVEEEWQEAWPPDMFLEGSDQHRGWFNVSLIVAAAIHGRAPYRHVLTHGMVLDDQGRKQSKRLGNVIDPVDVCDRLGADILRSWAASVDYENDFPCSEALIKVAGEEYRRIRNSLRFLLGNLSDYSGEKPEEPWLIDEWIVLKSRDLAHRVLGHYKRYEFSKAMSAIHAFCVNEVSAVYADAIKDRVYCDGADWPSRRSAQAACHSVLLTLVKLVAPILVHTAEEVYERIPGIERLETVHMETLLDDFEGFSAHEQGVIERMDVALLTREKVFSLMEKWRNESGVKDSQDLEVEITTDSAHKLILESLHEELANLFKVAGVTVKEGEFDAKFHRSQWLRCDRSRIRRPDVMEVEVQGELACLSLRDQRALGLHA